MISIGIVGFVLRRARISFTCKLSSLKYMKFIIVGGVCVVYVCIIFFFILLFIFLLFGYSFGLNWMSRKRFARSFFNVSTSAFFAFGFVRYIFMK